ncbi:hypothetical protein ACQP1V_43170 (plasmid) [Microtetraspora malaysiensis]|uniref:hypothetical protein n=1 Tax=Microtetraspora malaysiensis TaxID=161358 RepID=UPI003D8F4704
MSAKPGIPGHEGRERPVWGCYCAHCLKSKKVYEYKRKKAIAEGTWQPRMPAQPVRDHVKKIRDETGIGVKRLGHLIGINLSWLMYGKPDAGFPPPEEIPTKTGQAVLAFWPAPDDILDGTPIDGTGTRRRLQALVVAGWSTKVLDKLLDVDPSHLARITRGDDCVYAGFVRAVTRLYKMLWDQQPPETTKGERISAVKARMNAARKGWAPALAWEDGSIDDPSAKPNWSAVRCSTKGCERGSSGPDRRCKPCEARLRERGSLKGHKPLRKGAGIVEDAQWVIRTDRLITEHDHIDIGLVADRLNVTTDALEKALERAHLSLHSLREPV